MLCVLVKDKFGDEGHHEVLFGATGVENERLDLGRCMKFSENMLSQ